MTDCNPSSFSKDEYEYILKELEISDPIEIYQKVVPSKYILLSPPEISCISEENILVKKIKKMLSKNKIYEPEKIFAGLDVEPVYVPSIVKYLVSRGEFLTSYTPYQPEISQGILQALFEFQSIIAELTGMDVVNSSMYDWASSTAEALRMAMRVSRSIKVLIPAHLPKHRKSVIYTYLYGAGAEIKEYSYTGEGILDYQKIEDYCRSECAGLYIEYPDYYGYIYPEMRKVENIVHSNGGLFIVGIDLWSLPLLKPPSEFGADIVVGEGQPMGVPMNYGGPLLGIFGVKGDYKIIRQMPGRIIGMTNTLDKKNRAFTMILQTREQHIRREKATSNICSNEALTAVQVAIYISYLGKTGLLRKSLKMLRLSHYLYNQLKEFGFPSFYNLPFFRRFTLKVEDSHIRDAILSLRGKGYLPGFIDGNKWLINVHTLHTKSSMDNFIKDLSGVL